MDEIPELLIIDTPEQMRILGEPLRLQILDLLGQQAMTAKQVADTLQIASAKAHYHVHELERAGLVHLVETREKGGILEKYYRAVARAFQIASSVFQQFSRDEAIALAQQFLQGIYEQAANALGRSQDTFKIFQFTVRLTPQTALGLLFDIHERLRTLSEEDSPDTLPWSIAIVAHPVVTPPTTSTQGDSKS